MDILVEADMDIRRPLFNALARRSIILMMRPWTCHWKTFSCG